MPQKFLFLLFFFYILTLFQASFLVHFRILGVTPNFVLIAVVLINFFAPPKYGFFAGVSGGFCLDVFSPGDAIFFGFYTLLSIILAFFVNFFLKKHVRYPLFEKR